MGPFATATELYERIGEALPTDLARAQAFLEDASNLIRTTTGQVLSAVAGETIVLRPSSTSVLYLPENPVTTVTSVTENGVLLTTNTDYTFSSWGALTRWSSATHQLTKAWTYGATVVYSHGYAATTSEYGELRTLTIEMAGRALKGPNTGGPDFGNVFPEAVGQSPSIFLTDTERGRLMNIGAVPVG